MTIPLRNYLKFRYSAPSTACKCGNCQLVPLSEVSRFVAEQDALVKALEQMIEVYWADGDGELPEPQCIQDARAALAAAQVPA